MHNYTKKELMALITGKLRRNFGRDVDEATSLHMFKACALVLRDILSDRQMQTQDRTTRNHARQVHYLSLEFLMGRSLMKNAYNLGVLEPLKEAIEGLGFSAPELFESEPDAGLGNGGLGRLAACYLDSMTTLDIPATGYSICYELGIFKQKIVDGQQVELPDNWLGLGDAWLIPKMDEVEEVRFGGHVEDVWDERGRHSIRHTGYDSVLAVPKDMEIAGYGTEHVNVLRLWDSKSPQPVDMSSSPGASTSRRWSARRWPSPSPRSSTPRTITTRVNPCASSSSTSLSRPPFNPSCVSTGPSTAPCATSTGSTSSRSTTPTPPWPSPS